MVRVQGGEGPGVVGFQGVVVGVQSGGLQGWWSLGVVKVGVLGAIR